MSSHYHSDAYTTETQDGYPIKPPPPPTRYARVSNHQQEVITIPQQQPNAVGADSSNSSSGVMMVSTCNTYLILCSFLLPLIIHIILTLISGSYVVFLVPFLIGLIALIGMCVWMLSFNVTELGIERSQLIHFIIGRFAFGWWVIGMIFLVILALEGPIIYYIPIDNQVGAWFFLLFMAYILFAAQYVILIYVFCFERNVAVGTVWNARDNTMKMISAQSIAIGATVCTLWVTFLTFTYRLDFVAELLNIYIPTAFNELLIATAILLTASIVPLDALIGQYLVIRGRTRIICMNMHMAAAAGNINENEGLYIPIPSISRAIMCSIVLRGKLIMLMFFCLVGVLSTSGGWAAGVIVYIVLVILMLLFFAAFIRGQKRRLEQMTLEQSIAMQQSNHHHHQHQQVQLRVDHNSTNKYDQPDG